MAKASDNVFPKVILGMQTSNPSAPTDSSWKTFSKADGVYARSSNTVVGPFGASAERDAHGAFIYNSATQTPGTGAVTFNSEVRDSRSLHDTGSNTSRITVDATGWWLFSFQSRTDTVGGGVKPQKNGVATDIGAYAGSAATALQITGSWLLYLTSGDYVEFISNQSQTLGHASAFSAQTQAQCVYIGT